MALPYAGIIQVRFRGLLRNGNSQYHTPLAISHYHTRPLMDLQLSGQRAFGRGLIARPVLRILLGPELD